MKHWLEMYRLKQLDQEHTGWWFMVELHRWRTWPTCTVTMNFLPSDCAVSVLRHLINPLMSWIVTHGEMEVLSPEIVQGLVSDVFQNPEKGSVLEPCPMGSFSGVLC